MTLNYIEELTQEQLQEVQKFIDKKVMLNRELYKTWYSMVQLHDTFNELYYPIVHIKDKPIILARLTLNMTNLEQQIVLWRTKLDTQRNIITCEEVLQEMQDYNTKIQYLFELSPTLFNIWINTLHKLQIIIAHCE